MVLKKAEGYRGSVDPVTGQMLYESSDATAKRLQEGGEIARDLLNRMGARKIVGHDGTPSYRSIAAWAPARRGRTESP